MIQCLSIVLKVILTQPSNSEADSVNDIGINFGNIYLNSLGIDKRNDDRNDPVFDSVNDVDIYFDISEFIYCQSNSSINLVNNPMTDIKTQWGNFTLSLLKF